MSINSIMKESLLFFSLFFIIISGIFRFVFNKLHLLRSLLRLELLGVRVYWLFSLKFNLLRGEAYYGLFYLVIVVCEGVLGLSLLVCISWGYGRDYIKINRVRLC